jgi:cytochrome c
MSKLTKFLSLTGIPFVLLVGCSDQGPSHTQASAEHNIQTTAKEIEPSQKLSEIEQRIGGKPRPLDASLAGHYGVGTLATETEIAGWDIDVRTDGQGLPSGSGSALNGEEIYQNKCAACHGVFGEGAGRWPKLVGGADTLRDDRPEKTVGSYWPYATTLWDYIHRAMPFTQPQSLSNDEVYALTAYILYMNDIIEEELVLNAQNLASIQMPNKDGFFTDPRPDSTNTLCMKDCRNPDSIRITWDASDLGVTPVTHLSEKKSESVSREVEISAGEKTSKTACAVCHASGVAGAPIVENNVQEWQRRSSQGIDVLIRHANEGFTGKNGTMPAKGGLANLSDDQVEGAVRHMLLSAGIQ